MALPPPSPTSRSPKRASSASSGRLTPSEVHSLQVDKQLVVRASAPSFLRRHLETYLERIRAIRAGGRHTPELSYRGALENLLNALGHQLDPKVAATAEVADSGAGRPDFELLESSSGTRRGVVEVKSPGEPL